MIFLYIAFDIILLTLIISFICFYLTFYNKNSEKIRPENELPPGKDYEPYYNLMRSWMEKRESLSYRQFKITSFDGTILNGKYYELDKKAPLELMFHGYRGSAERDLCGGIERAFSLHRNVLIVDQRAHSTSGGNVITFGIKESRDVICWLNFINKEFGDNTEIILCGISMGAATVMLATSLPLPENVVGILADCGYSEAKDIICKTIKKMHLPARLLFPFVRLGGIIFGGFDINKASPKKALENCNIPIIFIHGKNDDFVPYEMSEINYAATKSKKRLLLVENAGHGAAYLVNPKEYLKALEEFFE